MSGQSFTSVGGTVILCTGTIVQNMWRKSVICDVAFWLYGQRNWIHEFVETVFMFCAVRLLCDSLVPLFSSIHCPQQ